MCLWGPAYLMAFWWNLCWFSPIRGLQHDLRNQRERLSYTSVSLICPKLKLNPYRIVSESSQMTSSRFPQGFEANCGVESTSKVTPGLNTISRFCVLDEWVVLSYMIMPFFPLSRLSREFFCCFFVFWIYVWFSLGRELAPFLRCTPFNHYTERVEEKERRKILSLQVTNGWRLLFSAFLAWLDRAKTF